MSVIRYDRAVNPSDPVLDALLAAIDDSPEVMTLRVRVVRHLMTTGRHSEAIIQCGRALRLDPANSDILDALDEASRGPAGSPTAGFDWTAAESQVKDIVAPAFATEFTQSPEADADLAKPTVRLSDVAGMDAVKREIEMACLAPVRNPELARAYGNTAGGGRLLYGPPGCGKTFIGSAIAGEIGASFYPIGIADVLDMYVGSSEKNLRDIFDTARRNTPCVLFFDELDALGQKRSQLRHATSMRQTVNQLLTEMDSATQSNDGLYVIGATNHPWDVDTALRRPGRFDRTLLVVPPDAAARAAIIRANLIGKPIAGIDLEALVASTVDFSGADLAHLCRSAARIAMSRSMTTGEIRHIDDDDVRAARAELSPSTGPWFDTARAIVEFANRDGSFDDLAAYMKSTRRRK